MDAFEKEYSKLKGKTVRRVVRDTEPKDDPRGDDTVYGLEFADGTTAWILRDPEGNGPGFLDLQAPAKPLKTPKPTGGMDL